MRGGHSYPMTVTFMQTQSLRRGRINHRAHLRDAIGREAALFGVLAHGLFIGRDVDAIDLVVGDVTLHPLDLWAHAAQHSARFLRDALQLRFGQLSGVGNFALNDELGHVASWQLDIKTLISVLAQAALASGSCLPAFPAACRAPCFRPQECDYFPGPLSSTLLRKCPRALA